MHALLFSRSSQSTGIQGPPFHASFSLATCCHSAVSVSPLWGNCFSRPIEYCTPEGVLIAKKLGCKVVTRATSLGGFSRCGLSGCTVSPPTAIEYWSPLSPRVSIYRTLWAYLTPMIRSLQEVVLGLAAAFILRFPTRSLICPTVSPKTICPANMQSCFGFDICDVEITFHLENPNLL